MWQRGSDYGCVSVVHTSLVSLISFTDWGKNRFSNVECIEVLLYIYRTYWRTYYIYIYICVCVYMSILYICIYVYVYILIYVLIINLWQPTLVFLPGKSHGQRTVAGLHSMRVTKSQTRLSDFTFTFHTCTSICK